MMKRILFFPLALVLTLGMFSVTAHAGQPSAGVTKLTKIDMKKGKGETATAGREVSVHYTGWLYDANVLGNKGRKFDSSLDRGTPIEFSLGAGMVIDGWEQGLEGMKVGGQRMLIIPPHLAYGAQGVPGAIPPNSALVFDVELMGVR